MKAQRIYCRQSLLLAAVASLFLIFGADLAANAQTNANKADQKPKLNRFEARDPRVCENTNAPARGAITAVLAQKYLNCQMESISGSNLYLIENLKSVAVGAGMPYAALIGQRSFAEIDVKHPVYPIRGSYLQYQCSDPVTSYSGPPNTNCTTYSHPQAKGYCYKTTFADWRCTMQDPAAGNKDNIIHGVAPPKD